MTSRSSKSPEKGDSARFVKVGENLYRLRTTGGYYGLIKKGGKQFRRSLRTTDRDLAKRRLNDLKSQVESLKDHSSGSMPFREFGERWLSMTEHSLKSATITRRRTCLTNVCKFFGDVPLRKVTASHCEKWLLGRGGVISASSFAQELGVMKMIFDHAIAQGIILGNPAAQIGRKKQEKKEMTIPTRDQFRRLVEAIRHSDGRSDSQQKAKPGADMVEFLAYSGCRINEARHVYWRDIDFEKETLTVRGGEEGTKNGETRVVPMTSSLIELLKRMETEKGVANEDDAIHAIADAKKCIQTACRRLEFPRFSHHDFRHFFATTCIESGVDIPTVSRWLGHKDGGALCMRTYGHLRDEHSASMIKRVNF